MSYDVILILAVAVPLIGSIILPLFSPISRGLRNILALAMVLMATACSSLLLPVVLSGQVVTFTKVFPLGFSFILCADKLAVFMGLVSSLISAVIVFYSFGYISHYKNQNEYYLMVVLFLGSMMGLIYSGSLVFLYLFWEITAICCWRLIGFFRKPEYVLRADKAFLVTVFGAVVMLLGFVMLYQHAGSFELAVIKEKFAGSPIPNLAVLLILFGILSKSATLPFHTWLPDAGVAPSPITALLHAAVLVKIGVYVFARLFVASFNIDPAWQVIVPAIAAVSSLVAAGAALVETDLKRIIAYSTVSQIGFIFLGLAIGNAAGIMGGLLYILMHGIAKAGLFLCAGIVEQNTKNKDITKLGGLFKTMPLTAVAFLFCAFSVMGVPPFGGFFSKYMVFNGAIQSGQIFLTFCFLAAAFMTIIYLFRVFSLVFLGQVKIAATEANSRVMVISVVILAILSLASGLAISYPWNFAQAAVKQMLGL